MTSTCNSDSSARRAQGDMYMYMCAVHVVEVYYVVTELDMRAGDQRETQTPRRETVESVHGARPMTKLAV